MDEGTEKDGAKGGNVRVSQAVLPKPNVAGITVTPGGARLNVTATSGGAIINSIRVGTSGRSIVISQQPIMKKPTTVVVTAARPADEEDDEGPPILQPQVATSTGVVPQQAPILAIPQPKPNTVMLVKTPDGRTLLISNKPQTPGGPCVISYQYVQLPLTGQAPQPASTSTPLSTPSKHRVQPGHSGRVQVSLVNRQPSLIRTSTAAQSIMSDHVYRGTQSPGQQGQTNLYGKRYHHNTSSSNAGPGRWLSVQPTHTKRAVQPSQRVQRGSSWYQAEYYEDEDAGAGPFSDDYAGIDEEEAGSTSLYLGGNDGPPELEPVGSVPFLRAVSGYGGHAYRRARPSGGAGYVQRQYTPGRYQGGMMADTAPSFLFNRRTVEYGDRVDRRRFQECKTVLNRMIDEVVELERQRKREDAKNRPKKSRTEYWRQYRLKRKFKRMQDDELNKRADAWVREIKKRRGSIQTMVNREIQRHITESAVSKVTNERVRLGWTMPSRPLKRATPVLEPAYTVTAPTKRSRYDTTMASTSNVNVDYSSSVVQASGGFPFSGGAGLYEVGDVIYGEGGVAEEALVGGVEGYQQQEEDQRAAEAIMGLAAAASVNAPDDQQTEEELAFEQQLHCICRQPLDRSKFYVMCDLCGRWFHGKCVGITEKKSRQMSTWSCRDCQKEKERATQELYCVCRTPYDETQPYICCDACDGWYHCQCVGVSPEEADSLPSFLCPNCLQASQGISSGATGNVTSMIPPDVSGMQDTSGPTSLAANVEIVSPLSAIVKRLDIEDYHHLMLLVRTLMDHQMSWPFRRGVDPKKMPNYFEVIKDPMDLSTVEARVKRRSYATLSEFARDVATIFNNARAFYPSDSPEFQCANVLDQYFTKELHDVKVAIAASVAEQQSQRHQQHHGIGEHHTVNINGRQF